MRLYLVQHGEAVVKDVDPARPLTDRGRRDAGKTAEFLRIAGITVDIIWHSAKQRARETAEIFAEILSLQKKLCQRDDLAPNDPVDSVYSEILSLKKNILMFEKKLLFCFDALVNRGV